MHSLRKFLSWSSEKFLQIYVLLDGKMNKMSGYCIFNQICDQNECNQVSRDGLLF